MARLRARAALAMVAALVVAGCGDASPPLVPPAADEPTDAGPVDAGPAVTCCRLDNARGERLDYQCGERIDAAWLEGRGYRCWLVQ